MSIKFKQTIIHTLDIAMSQPVISKNLLAMNDSIESFITKKLVSAMESSSICDAVFKEQLSFYPEDSLYYNVKNWSEDNFISLSELLAHSFYRYISEYGTIASGDLVVTSYIMNGCNYLGIFKVNFKEENTHYYDHEKNTASIITNKSIYEKNVIEASIVNLDLGSIQVLDETKSKYMQLLLDVEPKLSVKETIKAIERAASKVIDEYYDDPINAITELKNNITESIARTSTIPVEEVMRQTFRDNEEVLESCIDHMEEMGIKEINLEVRDNKISNKFSSQKIKTDTGIEIKVPIHLFKDVDFLEIVKMPNGTVNILIKNVSQMVNK